MASEEMGLLPTQRMDNITTSQLLLQEDNPVRRAAGDPGPGPGFPGDKFFSIENRDRYFSPEVRRGGGVYTESSPRGGSGGDGRSWRGNGSGSTPSSGDDDDDDEEDDDDHDHEEGDDAIEGLVRIGGSGVNNHSSNSGVVNKIGGEISKDHALFGSSTRQMMKDGGLMQPEADGNRASTSENNQQGRFGPLNQMVTIAERDGDVYYSQLLQGTEGCSQGQKDAIRDNGCGFSGRKDGSGSTDPAESLRAIFSDPITGALMEDAMIIPCGHSFGVGGIQKVIEMKACYTCSRPVYEDSVRPNLSLRTAIQAFLREEDQLMYRGSKRKRERFEQDKGNLGDLSYSESPRGRGVQFPFAVTDRVIIKGNKRTPQRFVGREAIVTTQCLNGWYVVKTLDNAESVKLQYRSLAKVVSDNPASSPASDRITPNWL